MPPIFKYPHVIPVLTAFVLNSSMKPVFKRWGEGVSRDIEKCSIQYLKSVLSSFDEQSDYVFWIRNADMSRQIYMSGTYNSVWQRDPGILYDIPLLWLDYLAKEGRGSFMRQFQERHEQGYQDPLKNVVLYQIETPEDQLRYLRDQCVKCENRAGKEFIVGMSRSIQADIWYNQFESNNIHSQGCDEKFFRAFLSALKDSFGISVKEPLNRFGGSSVSTLRQYLLNREDLFFSKREIECLFHLCSGKTAKQIAREMSISPRTVETYVESIRNKSDTQSKLEVISRFAHYFMGVQLQK